MPICCMIGDASGDTIAITHLRLIEKLIAVFASANQQFLGLIVHSCCVVQGV